MEEQKLNVGETIYDLIAEDRDLLIYRPTLRNICKSLSSTILLAQIMHRAKQSKANKFYKFKMPCDHIKYREGDSWCEELNFSKDTVKYSFSIVLRFILEHQYKEKQKLRSSN